MDEDMLYDGIRTRMRERRRKLRMTQAALAAASGVSRVALLNVEHGRKHFSLTRLCRVAEVLQVSPAWLVFGEEERHETRAGIWTMDELGRNKPHE
jgi:transcriptional regulator with XRE-family HTH domain